MATNADKEEKKVADETNSTDDKEVTDADLKNLKKEVEGVEPAAEATGDEPETEAKSEKKEEVAEGEKPADITKSEGFNRKFKNIKGETPEEYAKNLEIALDNSTSEALKIKKMYEDAAPALKKAEEIVGETANTSPALLYAQQMMQESIDKDTKQFAADYPQMSDPDEYAKLSDEVGIVSRAIREGQNRIPSMKEVLERSAVILGWTKGGDETVAAAVMDSASSTKTATAAKATKGKTGVTDAQVKVARNLFPGLDDTQIRKELEAYSN